MNTTDPETAQADRWTRREPLLHLLSRACRAVLTPNEGPLLRAAVETELADAEIAHQELANQRETFDIAWEQQAADLERARDVAVQLENENARLEDELRNLRGALDWQTSCLACARVLESGYAETARAEGAEQQLANVRAFADELCAEPHPTHDHVCPDDVRSGLLAALAAPAGPECTGCDDTGACNGGPCAHPNAPKETPR